MRNGWSLLEAISKDVVMRLCGSLEKRSAQTNRALKSERQGERKGGQLPQCDSDTSNAGRTRKGLENSVKMGFPHSAHECSLLHAFATCNAVVLMY
jgi:hypothetical protein